MGSISTTGRVSLRSDDVWIFHVTQQRLQWLLMSGFSLNCVKQRCSLSATDAVGFTVIFFLREKSAHAMRSFLQIYFDIYLSFVYIMLQ